VLHNAGIYTFSQLAQTPVSKLQEITLAAGLRLVDPTTWPEQAAALAR
jgi:predicted flap endonuclease-1-like 5' DNA nuclease